MSKFSRDALNVVVLVEELQGLLPVDVVVPADVLDGVALVCGLVWADLAAVWLDPLVDQEVLLHVGVPKGLVADGALRAAVEARPHVEPARARLHGCMQAAVGAAGRYELDLRMMGGGHSQHETWSQPWQHRPRGRHRGRQQRHIGEGDGNRKKELLGRGAKEEPNSSDDWQKHGAKTNL